MKRAQLNKTLEIWDNRALKLKLLTLISSKTAINVRAKERWLAGMRTRNKLCIFKIKVKVGSVHPAEWWGGNRNSPY